MFSNLEVKLDSKDQQALRELITLPEYVAFERYLGLLLEKHRTKLEKENDDLIRGECRRIRRILELRQHLS